MEDFLCSSQSPGSLRFPPNGRKSSRRGSRGPTASSARSTGSRVRLLRAADGPTSALVEHQRRRDVSAAMPPHRWPRTSTHDLVRVLHGEPVATKYEGCCRSREAGVLLRRWQRSSKARQDQVATMANGQGLAKFAARRLRSARPGGLRVSRCPGWAQSPRHWDHEPTGKQPNPEAGVAKRSSRPGRGRRTRPG